MCDPFTIGALTATLSLGQSVMQYQGQKQAYEANAVAANINYARDREAIQRQESQLADERSETSLDTAIAALRSQSLIAASATARGLAAPSIAQALNADMFGIGRNATIEDLNYRNQFNELARAREDAQVARTSQINSRVRPSVGSLLLGVGEAGLSGYNAYKGSSNIGRTA